MKKLIVLLVAVLIGFISANAQNPFAKYGYEPKIATLSQGQFIETFDNDTIVQIGSVMFNTKSKQIVAFVQQDTMYSEATLQPDIVSRWISPDPLADHPTQIGLTPYHYAGNNPIYWTDPDGRYPWCLVYAAVEVGIAIYDAYETGTTIIDPNASTSEKFAAAGGFVLGAILPGGGYGTAAKQTAKTVDKVMDAGKVMDKASDATKAVDKGSDVVKKGDGVIYKRTDKTGNQKDYVGQAKSEDRYKARQKEHQRANKDADYDFTEIDRGTPGKDLNMKEQKHIDAGGGPTNKSNPSGGLSNKKNAIKKQ